MCDHGINYHTLKIRRKMKKYQTYERHIKNERVRG